MATPTSYYSDKNFLNVAYAVNLSLINHFSSMLFDKEDTTDRVIYSSNAYAFRKRADNNSGNINLPFFNFRNTSYEAGERSWWNASLYTTGMYISELGVKVKAAPITIGNEASFWCARDDELRYAFSELVFDSDNKTILNQVTKEIPKPYVTIDGQNVSLPAVLSYTGLDYEPEYNEQEWLERNNIHSASANFEVNTFALKTNSNITIPTELLLEFAYKFDTVDDINTEDYDELRTFVIDHVLEDVYE